MSFRCLGIISLFFLSFILKVQAQQNQSLKSFEDSCVVLFKDLRLTQGDEEKKIINQKILSGFKRVLKLDSSFIFPFDSLKVAARPYSPDKTIRVISWFYALDNGSYQYFGFIQTAPDKKNGGSKLFELTDRPDITNPENSVLSAGKWLGALYYKILRNKVDNRIYYSILALRYHDVLVTKKIVEILYFDEWDNPVFGAPIIQYDKKLKHRLVFEYSAMATMNLRYDDKKGMIIFDHLSPSETRYAGMPQYYGPDLTFDGLQFKKNKWQYIPNLDLRRASDPKPVKSPPR